MIGKQIGLKPQNWPIVAVEGSRLWGFNRPWQNSRVLWKICENMSRHFCSIVWKLSWPVMLRNFLDSSLMLLALTQSKSQLPSTLFRKSFSLQRLGMSLNFAGKTVCRRDLMKKACTLQACIWQNVQRMWANICISSLKPNLMTLHSNVWHNMDWLYWKKKKSSVPCAQRIPDSHHALISRQYSAWQAPPSNTGVTFCWKRFLRSWMHQNLMILEPHDVGDFLEVVIQLAQSFGGFWIPIFGIFPQSNEFFCAAALLLKSLCDAIAKHLSDLPIKFDEEIGFLLSAEDFGKAETHLPFWRPSQITNFLVLMRAMLQLSQCETCSLQILRRMCESQLRLYLPKAPLP